MKTIVITGSTRGIGHALAREFLRRGCQVVISGRTNEAVKTSLNTLRNEFPQSQLDGFPCDVTRYSQVEQLWAESVARFKTIDIWINNAGISNRQFVSWELSEVEIRSVVETNLLGELYGTRVAMRGFLEQGYVALYNVEGLGANGKTNNVRGLSIYGMTKAGLNYFNRCLKQEVNLPSILVCSLQPGMILTDMVKGQYREKPDEWEKVKGILGIISSPIEGATAWLAERILSNQKSGVRFAYGGYLRMLKRLIALPFNRTKLQ